MTNWKEEQKKIDDWVEDQMKPENIKVEYL